MCAYNPSTWKAEAGGSRVGLKKKKKLATMKKLRLRELK
jgi:hypothetical protein